LGIFIKNYIYCRIATVLVLLATIKRELFREEHWERNVYYSNTMYCNGRGKRKEWGEKCTRLINSLRARRFGQKGLSPNESKTWFGRRGRPSIRGDVITNMLSDVINRPRRFHFICRRTPAYSRTINFRTYERISSSNKVLWEWEGRRRPYLRARVYLRWNESTAQALCPSSVLEDASPIREIFKFTMRRVQTTGCLHTFMYAIREWSVV